MNFAKFLRATFFKEHCLPVAVTAAFPEGNEIIKINGSIGTKWIILMFQKVFSIFQIGTDTDLKI